jgi:hypothetical protein
MTHFPVDYGKGIVVSHSAKKNGVCELLAGALREATDYEIRLSMQPCAFGPHRCLRPWRCMKHTILVRKSYCRKVIGSLASMPPL